MDTYEKKYNEALERAKELLLGNEHSNTIRSYFEHIFPELRESEDERIRKRIKGLIYHNDALLDKDELLAWLEKQKEQKPAEWSEEDEKNWRLVLNEIKDCELRCWFYSVWERLTYHKPQWKPTEEQKPVEWSEEDERRIDAICELLENTSAIHPNYSHRKLIIWLKDLRPIKQEWSKKDEDKLYQVMETLLADKTVALRDTPNCKALHEAYDEMLAWLKSLRPSWKPSKEQMSALKECGECKRCIKELYEHLKKL